MNVILCGNSGAGKSTAIRRLLREINEPIYGFWTEKLAPDPDGSCPVYIHGCREALSYSCEHLIGVSCNRQARGYSERFEDLGVHFLSDIPENAIVLMDEIGCMENEARTFIREIFRILDGNFRVIAAVREKHTPLLDAIRQHPKSCCIAAAEAETQSLLQLLEA